MRTETCCSVGSPDSTTSLVRQAELTTGEGGDLAGETDHRQGVASVRLDVDVQDDLADHLGHGLAERQLVAVPEDVNAIRIGPDLELDGAAQHPVADFAANLRALDPAFAGQDRPDHGRRHELPGLEVLGTAHDAELAAGRSDIDPRQPQRVGVRMAAHRRAHARPRRRSSPRQPSRPSSPPCRAWSAHRRARAGTARCRRTRAASDSGTRMVSGPPRTARRTGGRR